MDILQVGTRRFRIPHSGGAIGTKPEHLIEIDWPSNKKMSRMLCDSLEELKIPYLLSPDNQLFVNHKHPDLIKHMLQFKIRTFNHSYTHFISLPLYNNSQLRDNFEQFKEDAMDLLDLPKKYAAMGHKSRLFTMPNRLHLTMLMVTVMDEKDLELGRCIIDSLQVTIPVECVLNGLDVIKGTPEAARVLIAKVDDNVELERLAAELRSKFLLNGLSDTIDTLWHCTLANAKYFDRFYKTHGCTFDARKALRKLSFGPIIVAIDSIQFSSLKHEKSDPTEYYHAESIKYLRRNCSA